MFLDGYDNNPAAARSAAFQALYAYQAHSFDDLQLSFRIIAFSLAETRCRLAALDGKLTPAQRNQFLSHAASFKDTVQRHATFLGGNATALDTQMAA